MLCDTRTATPLAGTVASSSSSGEAGGGKTVLLRAYFSARPGGSRFSGAHAMRSSHRGHSGRSRNRRGRRRGLAELVRTGGDTISSRCSTRRDLRDGPTVLVLEDVHWADEATLDVLKLLVRRIESLPVLVVLTLPRRGSARRRTR